MNFMLHRCYALSELGSALGGIGAMLPDLWRLADRRMRAQPEVPPQVGDDAELQRGVEHHLEVDRWFHKTAAFLEGERATAACFREVGAPKVVLFAHIGWEMCLDGALLLREGLDDALRSLRDDFAAADDGVIRVAAAHGAARRLDTRRKQFERRMGQIRDGLVAGPWLEGYCHGEGLAERLGGLRKRIGLDPLTDAQQDRLSLAFEERLRHAPAALEKLWVERRAHGANA